MERFVGRGLVGVRALDIGESEAMEESLAKEIAVTELERL